MALGGVLARLVRAFVSLLSTAAAREGVANV